MTSPIANESQPLSPTVPNQPPGSPKKKKPSPSTASKPNVLAQPKSSTRSTPPRSSPASAVPSHSQHPSSSSSTTSPFKASPSSCPPSSEPFIPSEQLFLNSYLLCRHMLSVPFSRCLFRESATSLIGDRSLLFFVRRWSWWAMRFFWARRMGMRDMERRSLSLAQHLHWRL